MKHFLVYEVRQNGAPLKDRMLLLVEKLYEYEGILVNGYFQHNGRYALQEIQEGDMTVLGLVGALEGRAACLVGTIEGEDGRDYNRLLDAFERSDLCFFAPHLRTVKAVRGRCVAPRDVRAANRIEAAEDSAEAVK